MKATALVRLRQRQRGTRRTGQEHLDQRELNNTNNDNRNNNQRKDTTTPSSTTARKQ